jgi:hypothetical protein
VRSLPSEQATLEVLYLGSVASDRRANVTVGILSGIMHMVHDQLLRRSFHAAGQPARAQIGGRSRCPWVTAGDRSFPLVLARTWHAATRKGNSVRLPRATPALLVSASSSRSRGVATQRCATSGLGMTVRQRPSAPARWRWLAGRRIRRSSEEPGRLL